MRVRPVIVIEPNDSGTRFYVECATCDEPLGFALPSREVAEEKGKLHWCHPSLLARKAGQK
jgi:hypothetical protein